MGNPAAIGLKKCTRQRFRPRKIDEHSEPDKRLYKLAKRPLHDLLPCNSEFHNFSSVHLTERQTKVLGLGLHFKPTFRPPTEVQFHAQIQDFCRRVRLQDILAHAPQDRPYVPTGWNLPRQNPDLENKLYFMCKELRRNITVNKPHWRNNLTKQERIELKELKANPGIRILPQTKIRALLSCLWIGFKLRLKDICMTSYHIAKSCQRTGMLATVT